MSSRFSRKPSYFPQNPEETFPRYYKLTAHVYQLISSSSCGDKMSPSYSANQVNLGKKILLNTPRPASGIYEGDT